MSVTSECVYCHQAPGRPAYYLTSKEEVHEGTVYYCDDCFHEINLSNHKQYPDTTSSYTRSHFAFWIKRFWMSIK